MRCKSRLFLGILFVVLFVNFLGVVSASFEIGNISHYIENEYKPSEDVSGWINLSFNNESINSTFEDSFGNSISLYEILSLNDGYVYSFNDSSNQTLDSNFSRFYLLDFNFSVGSSGNYSYELNFSGLRIFSQNITVRDMTKEIQAGEMLEEKRSNLERVKFDLTSYSVFERRAISNFLGLEEFESKLDELEINFSSADDDSDYESILSSTEELETLPKKISVLSEAKDITFYAEEKNINLNLLKEIGGGDYDSSDRESIYERVFLWNQENLETKVSYKKIVLEYEDSKEDEINFFDFKFNDNPRGAYFVVEDLESLEFKQSYSEENKSGYKYIEMQSPTGISFSTTEDYDFSNVPVFISPPIDDLPKVEVGEYIDSTEEVKISRWALFSLVIGLLLILGLVLYHILQTWYKNRYENYLFKNRNDLYNLIVYINSSKKKGMKDDEIKRNLKKAKWKGEQIDYVLKKYVGKRTGLPELNLFKSKKNQNK